MLIFRDLICNLNFFLSLQPKWINQSGTSLALTRIKLAKMDGIEIKVDEILTMINTSRRTLYRIIADLRKDGFVENIGNKNHPKWNVYNG